MTVYLKNRYTEKVITKEEFLDLDSESQSEYDIIPFDSIEYEILSKTGQEKKSQNILIHEK